MHRPFVIDPHVHLARWDSLHMPVERWAPPGVTGVPLEELYADGVPRADAFLAHLDAEGIDVVLLMAEYSPRVTGIQSIEANAVVAAAAPHRVGLVAAVNPHLHFPAVAELDRQLDLGAVALKVHAVHGDFDPTRADLYPVYARCADAGIPVVVHCGTSNFAGASNDRADVASLAPIVRDFPDLPVLLAHGGRGWSYDAAAWFAMTYPNVWIELSGLPPHRLPSYFASVGLQRLAPRCVFASDFPAIPGLRANADAVVATLLGAGVGDDVVQDVMCRNAARLYGFHRVPAMASHVAAMLDAMA